MPNLINLHKSILRPTASLRSLKKQQTEGTLAATDSVPFPINTTFLMHGRLTAVAKTALITSHVDIDQESAVASVKVQLLRHLISGQTTPKKPQMLKVKYPCKQVSISNFKLA